MRKIKLITFVTALLLLLIGSIIITNYITHNQKETQKTFYVGVTYCGNSVQEAKELVDKVKNYTNLFTLQSGTMQNATEVEEIGDYVVASKMSFAVYNSDKIYYGTVGGIGVNQWALSAKERWKEQFIGIYYRDEPGGDLLDGKLVNLEKTGYQINEYRGETEIVPSLTKYGESITVYERDQDGRITSTTAYWPDGRVNIRTYNRTNNELIQYFPNGTIIINKTTLGNFRGTSEVYTEENITKHSSTIQSYEQVLKQNPIQNNDDAAKAFVNMNQKFLDDINKKQLNKESISVFTADYGLYWWEYKGGYDFVLAELGWNNSITQEISLVRGAANLQNKEWGTILTWKYTHPPYLTDGEEMFEQMKISYEAGANYVIIFNYSEDPINHNTLQEEHFQALERFWKDIVQNPKVIHGGIKAEAVLVLPQNYGWGMRNPQDTLWGLWYADNTTQKIWNQLQDKTEQYDLKLDIVFEDPNHLAIWKYNKVYYWNQK
ncbi:MAG: hypothetical protein FWH37_02360 [Candidatus Bathyarchaeota archaeon]|nr:hypothetical protein [Candidatus Termiticorpusculum sp.]